MTQDLSSLDDLQLVDAINLGDQSAFGVLYERHKTWVLNLAYRFTGHHDDSLDVLQETFAYVARKFPGFELTAQMTTFLYPAVKNYSLTAKKKRQRATGGSECLDAVLGRDDEGETSGGELKEMLSALSDAHREILLMRFVDGMTQPEIATALNVALGTVKSRLHHAVHAVRDSPAAKRLLENEQSQ